MMGIVVPETCRAYTKYNKQHLVGFYSSVITMMHGPTHIKIKEFVGFVKLNTILFKKNCEQIGI